MADHENLLDAEAAYKDIVYLLKELSEGKISQLFFIMQVAEVLVTPVTKVLHEYEDEGKAEEFISFSDLYELYDNCGFTHMETGVLGKHSLREEGDNSIASLVHDIFMVPLLNQIGKKVKTEFDRQELGAQVAALVMFGSNRHQAEQAISEWHGVSLTKVKSGYVELKSTLDEDNLDYYLACFQEVKIPKEKFPRHYEQAYKAFENIYNELANY